MYIYNVLFCQCIDSSQVSKNLICIGFFHQTGVYPIVAITHIDRPDAETEGLKLRLKALGVTEIYEVENLHKPDHTHLSKKDQLNLLRLVDRCVTNSDRNLQFAH